MYDPKDVVELGNDPLSNRTSRPAVVMADTGYNDWADNGRYNVVCLTTDFDEYESHPHTIELDKDADTAVGSLESHSLACPWATLALPARNLDQIIADQTTRNVVTLTDSGHEKVTRAVYQFFSAQNDYTSN